MWNVEHQQVRKWPFRSNEYERLKKNEQNTVGRKILHDAREKQVFNSTYILKRIKKLIRHSINHITFIINVFDGRILSRSTRGRPRTWYFQDLKKLMDVISYMKLKDIYITTRDIRPLRQNTAVRRWWWIEGFIEGNNSNH